MREENSIVVENVTKKYDGFTLKDVSFVVPKGCIMGLIGENGAGKSTTLRLILGMAKQNAGSITVLGQKNKMREQAMLENIGVVFDECCFPDEMNAADVNQSFRHIYRQWDSDAYGRYIAQFGLPQKKAVKTFSRGMKMKLAIAVALSHHAKLLVMDEATSGLDPVVREQILDVFLDFIQDEEHSVLLSSHIITDLEKVCDYITFIHQGKVLLSEEKDLLLEEYGILKTTKTMLQEIEPSAIISKRESSFDVEALVLRQKMPAGAVVDRAGLEDIMLFMIQGQKQSEGLAGEGRNV